MKAGACQPSSALAGGQPPRIRSAALRPSRDLRHVEADLEQHSDRKLILFSAARVDYTKATSEDAAAYERFAWRPKTLARQGELFLGCVGGCLVANAASTTTIQRAVEEIVGPHQRRFARIDWTPVRPSRTRGFPTIELVGLVSGGRCLLGSPPCADGPQLVAKEYVAARVSRMGCCAPPEFTTEASVDTARGRCSPTPNSHAAWTGPCRSPGDAQARTVRAHGDDEPGPSRSVNRGSTGRAQLGELKRSVIVGRGQASPGRWPWRSSAGILGPAALPVALARPAAGRSPVLMPAPR